jgi:hypothetical protein
MQQVEGDARVLDCRVDFYGDCYEAERKDAAGSRSGHQLSLSKRGLRPQFGWPTRTL